MNTTNHEITRRRTLRAVMVTGIGLALTPHLAAAAAKQNDGQMMTAAALPAPSARPNIVLIVADDMGYADIGATGVKDIDTPALDRLARGGAFFADAYVTGPMCVPSRMGIMMGRHQARWGIYSNNDGYTAAGQRATAAEITVAEYLKEAGYATALFGKWHLCGNNLESHTLEGRPEANGFDEVEMIPGGMAHFWEGSTLYQTGGRTVKAPEYLTDHFGKLAADFITRKKDDPFFVALTFTAVHAPLHALDEDVEAVGGGEDYDAAKYRSNLARDRRNPVLDRPVYAAMLRAMDRNIGRVLDTLDALGLADSTLVAFCSDHGGPAHDAPVHSYNMACNGPLRGHKFDLWEGGIRAPMLLRWPGHVPAAKRYDKPVSTMDLSATFLAAAGIRAAEDRPLDGVDLLPFLTSKVEGEPHDSLAWSSVWGRKTQDALRRGDWKLIRTGESSRGSPKAAWQLFNLEDDIGETTDLAPRHPEVVASMVKAWEIWRSEMADPIK
jgi:arylsulfatase A-like enzyme